MRGCGQRAADADSSRAASQQALAQRRARRNEQGCGAASPQCPAQPQRGSVQQAGICTPVCQLVAPHVPLHALLLQPARQACSRGNGRALDLGALRSTGSWAHGCITRQGLWARGPAPQPRQLKSKEVPTCMPCWSQSLPGTTRPAACCLLLTLSNVPTEGHQAPLAWPKETTMF